MFLKYTSLANNTVIRKEATKTLQLLLLTVLFFSVAQHLQSQSRISGTINEYAAVESVESNQSVTVKDASIFQPRDTVLLIQMKGLGILTSPPADYGKQQNINNAGNYEFLIISDISGNTITFTREFLKEYSAVETLQLVRVRGYENVTVTGPLTATPWDGEKGGIVALIVTNTLYLEDNIDLSAAGFRGAEPVMITSEVCAASDPGTYSAQSFPEGSEKAGRKGEGSATYYIVDADNFLLDDQFAKGKGRFATGGGGGNGLFSGGGGGANFGQGGFGGNETETCSDPGFDTGGAGGYWLRDQLFDASANFRNRLYMAGAGGGATGSSERNATSGGRGGGMVIIVANYIEGSDEAAIIADGESVTGIAAAGAGGGGGGGTIVASIDHYRGVVNMFARGGKGGDVEHSDMGGPGGGGGGGVIIHSGPGLPEGANTVVLPGPSGTNTIQNEPNESSIGTPGGLIEQLEISLNGILFNGIRTERLTICEENTPDILEGTIPRGGERPYEFFWLRRPAGDTEWTVIAGAEERDYQPGPLTESTEFMRIVEDKDFPPVIDSSNILTIAVEPKILGNVIYNNQTICAGDQPGRLDGDIPFQGGTGTFEYDWNFYTEETRQWTQVEANNGGVNYLPPPLADTTLFIRVVTSGVCIDTSGFVAIDVHPEIRNNLLDDDQTICHGDTPGGISAPVALAGGLGDGSYSYSWETDKDGSWNPVNGGWTSSSYSPGSLTGTTRYRRTAESGECQDTSPPHTIIVLPLISGNTISESQVICYMAAPELFEGSEPEGGDGIYSYRWEISAGSSPWETAEGDPDERDYMAPPLSDTTSFRRIVFSGENDACRDTSNITVAEFYPLSFGSISGINDTICEGEQIDLAFTFNGEFPMDLVYTDGSQLFTAEGLVSPDFSTKVTPSTPDSSDYSYTFYSLVDGFGCSVPEKHLTGSLSGRVYAFPEPDPGTGGDICGPTFSLDAAATLGRGMWEISSGNATFSPGPSNPGATVTVEEYGTYTLTWTETNWRCRADDNITVTFYEQPENTFAGEDQEYYYTFETLLGAELPPGMPEAYGKWEVVEGGANIVFPDSPSTEVTGLGFGENIFSWTLYNGVCQPVSDMVTILIRDIDAPTGFSPNNSGFNDTFIIRGLENSTTNELTIFNRQGNVVFRSNNYMNDWDGRNNSGVHLPEDTYYYIISVDNKYTYKGFIVLRR
ncbi:MAG: gliding motility-associated C-terminal domain-containing protein [Marinilabiliales bacterium]|nr:MAG: gliding motility-associated C-terminal domain-containing protein [Marinilabiliales bacterium]